MTRVKTIHLEDRLDLNEKTKRIIRRERRKIVKLARSFFDEYLLEKKFAYWLEDDKLKDPAVRAMFEDSLRSSVTVLFVERHL